MSEMKKVGKQLQKALAVGVPAELAAIIVATNHPVRLKNLCHQGSLQLLALHRDVQEREAQQRPSLSVAQQLRERMKALVDLVRARAQALGERKPSVEAMLKMLDMPVDVADVADATTPVPVPENVVQIRRVA
jgi:hypothetical protein